MSLGRVLVGYRKGDRRIYQLNAANVTRCACCNAPTFFVRTGQIAYMERDPQVLCDDCYQRYKDEVTAEL